MVKYIFKRRYFITMVFLVFLFFPFSFASYESGIACSLTNYSLMRNMQDIMCITKDLRTAVQKEGLLKQVAGINFFHGKESNDIVRSVGSISFLENTVGTQIKEIHNKYQKKKTESYTLGIVSYPSKIKKGTCEDKKTIDFNPANSTEDLSYHEYSTIEGKKPRYFQVANYKGKNIICEKTKLAYKERVKRFCGEKICDIGGGSNNQCVKENLHRNCKNKLPPSCDKIAQKNGKAHSDSCVSLENFKKVSKKLLLKNPSLLLKYCPDDCSYYTQVVQRVYKKEIEDKYCSDNYLIVHCGPKRDGSTYNLNIKEVKNICSDFGSAACKAFVRNQTEKRLL